MLQLTVIFPIAGHMNRRTVFVQDGDVGCLLHKEGKTCLLTKVKGGHLTEEWMKGTASTGVQKHHNRNEKKRNVPKHDCRNERSFDTGNNQLRKAFTVAIEKLVDTEMSTLINKTISELLSWCI